MLVFSPSRNSLINLFYALYLDASLGKVVQGSMLQGQKPRLWTLSFVHSPKLILSRYGLVLSRQSKTSAGSRFSFHPWNTSVFISCFCVRQSLLSVEIGPTKWQLIVLVEHADEQEIAAAESAQEEKPSGVKAQCGRPWDDQIPVGHPLWHPQPTTPCTWRLCL